MFNNILSRWIKNNRDTVETDDNIDIGLKNMIGSPIFFSKYKFNSNTGTATINSWLSSNSFIDTQYIGFFKYKYVVDWINKPQSTDYYSHFASQGNFFVFKALYNNSTTNLTTNSIFSTKNMNTPINIKKIEKPTLDTIITVEENIFKFFEPPKVEIFFEDGTRKSTEENPGEIDIVANNMAVYGIKCRSANDLINNINYSDDNITLINNVLDQLNASNFKLLNKKEIRNLYTEKFKNRYFKYIKKNISKIPDEYLNILGNPFNEELKFNISLDKYGKFFDKVNEYLEKNNEPIIKLPTLNIELEINNYISSNFLNALLIITTYLNNVETHNNTRQILQLVEQAAIQTRANAEVENSSKKQKRNYNKKYLKYKAKYLELKNKIIQNYQV